MPADLPSLRVHHPVMEPAQQHSIGEVGLAAFAPWGDVVGFAESGRDPAARMPTPTIPGGKCDALHGREQALRTPDVER